MVWSWRLVSAMWSYYIYIYIYLHTERERDTHTYTPALCQVNAMWPYYKIQSYVFIKYQHTHTDTHTYTTVIMVCNWHWVNAMWPASAASANSRLVFFSLVRSAICGQPRPLAQTLACCSWARQRHVYIVCNSRLMFLGSATPESSIIIRSYCLPRLLASWSSWLIPINTCFINVGSWLKKKYTCKKKYSCKKIAGAAG
jgi:hypothetical protein